MFNRIILSILSFSFFSTFGMYQHPTRHVQTNATLSKQRKADTRGKDTTVQELKATEKELRYFHKLSKLETRLNKFIDKATDYNLSINLIDLALVSNPEIDAQDKQELEVHYKKILDDKFKDVIKKSSAQ